MQKRDVLGGDGELDREKSTPHCPLPHDTPHEAHDFVYGPDDTWARCVGIEPHEVPEHHGLL